MYTNLKMLQYKRIIVNDAMRGNLVLLIIAFAKILHSKKPSRNISTKLSQLGKGK